MVRTDRSLDRGALEVRGARLAWGLRTYVIAIVNVTPDSFSGDGIENAQAAAARAVEQWSWAPICWISAASRRDPDIGP